MNRSRLRIGLVALAITGALVLAAGCGDDEDSDSTRINLIASSAEPTDIDNGKNGPSEGDLAVFDAEVTFADGGEPAGRIYGVQTTVSLDDQSEIVQASFTYKLSDGTISVGGISEYPKGDNALVQGQEFERPIVGGTGKYSGAAGTDTTILNADGRYEHELLLED